MHRNDLLLLLNHDLLRDAAQLLVLSVLQFGARHIDSALMVWHHHRHEIIIDVPLGLTAMWVIMVDIAVSFSDRNEASADEVLLGTSPAKASLLAGRKNMTLANGSAATNLRAKVEAITSAPEW